MADREQHYDCGGFLSPGLTLARNDTGVPERVEPLSWQEAHEPPDR